MRSKKSNSPVLMVLSVSIILQLMLPQITTAQEDEMEDAVISLAFEEGDENNSVVAMATDDSGNPIADLELYFYVERTFSLLPFGDAFNMTDEEGTVKVAFPNDLPGDENGNVTIVVKLMESDTYKDQTLEAEKNWGIAQDYNQNIEERSLSATGVNAPWSLVIFTSTLILASWYIYWHIIYKLYQISKIKPEDPTN